MSAPAAYPLCWPAGWPRWKWHRDYGRFKVSPGRAQDELVDELVRMGAQFVTISTNIELRRDGLPYANRNPPNDPGVAVYFQIKGKPMVLACDQYDKVWKNMRAIGKTIEALRAIKRYGSSDLLERAYVGFNALPDYTEGKEPWYSVLGCQPEDSFDVVRSAWIARMKEVHPDKGGSDAEAKRVNEAWAQAREALEGKR